MSETIRYALAEPGAAEVRLVPNWTEHAGAGRRELDDAGAGGVTSSRHPSRP